MDPASLIPTPDAIPVHWFWLQLLLTSTTFLHFMAMNIMLGTGFIAFAAPYFRDDVLPMNRAIAKALPITIAFTVNLGVAPLLFLQVLYGQFLYTSSILMAVFWLAIIDMLLISYYAVYIYTLNNDKLGLGRLTMSIAVFFLLAVTFLFCNNLSIMQLPETWVNYFSNRGGWQLNFSDAALVPRYLHFVASAIAIGGLAIAVYFDFQKKRGDSSAEQWIKHGCNWFTYATVINFGIGFWFLGALPESAYNPATFLGKIFFIMIVASVFTIVMAVVYAYQYRLIHASAYAAATVLLMTLARDVLKLAYLKPYFSLSDLPQVSQYSPFIVFLVFFILAGKLIWWMLKTMLSDKEVA
jgi:hypothetical protein